MNATHRSFYVESGTWYSYAMLIIAILSFLTSSTVVFVIARKKSLLERKGNIYLLALLLTHICIGLQTTVQFATEFITGHSMYNSYKSNNIFYKAMMYMHHFLFMVAFVMANLVTLDCLLAVKRPYYYEQCSSKFCYGTILLGLIPPIMFILMSSIGGVSYSYYMFVLIGIFLSVFIAITNMTVYNVVKKQIIAISKNTVTENRESRKRILDNLNKQKFRSARLCLFIVLSTVLFLLPMEISTIVMLIMKDAFWNDNTKHVAYISEMFILLNSLKDPMLYIFINKDVKREICKRMNSVRASQSTSAPSSAPSAPSAPSS